MAKKIKIVKAKKDPEPTTKFVRGEKVEFVGTRHYTTPMSKIFFTIKPGVATVDAVMENEVKHPYHLTATTNSKSTVNGWVDEADIQKYEEPKDSIIKDFSKSKEVKIASATNVNGGIDISATNWENQLWKMVFRFKDPEMAEKIAHAAEISCAKKRVENTEVFQLMFAEICAEVAELNLGESLTAQKLTQSGLFYIFTSNFYTQEFQYLRRGDILFNGNNCAIVLSNGKKSGEQMPTSNAKLKEEELKVVVKKEKPTVKPEDMEIIQTEVEPEEKDGELSGAYIGISPVYMRNGAGIDAPILKRLPKGITVRNYGYFTEAHGIKWLYVQATYKNVVYNGFVSERCLVKK